MSNLKRLHNGSVGGSWRSNSFGTPQPATVKAWNLSGSEFQEDVYNGKTEKLKNEAPAGI